MKFSNVPRKPFECIYNWISQLWSNRIESLVDIIKRYMHKLFYIDKWCIRNPPFYLSLSLSLCRILVARCGQELIILIAKNKKLTSDAARQKYTVSLIHFPDWLISTDVYVSRGIKQCIHTSLSVDWFGFERSRRTYIHFVKKIPCVKSTGDSVCNREMDGEIQQIQLLSERCENN